jgi:phosphate transport system permease protein
MSVTVGPASAPTLTIVNGSGESPWPDYDEPRSTRQITSAVLTEFLIAAAAGIGVSLMLRLVLDWGGILGTVVWAYMVFVGALYVLVRDRETAEVATDRLVTTFMWTAGVVVIATLGWMLAFLFVHGVKKLRPGFFTQDLSKVSALDEGGGAKHAIIGTLEQVGLAAAAVVPIGIMTAVYLNEIRGRMTKPIRFIVDAMSGLPSIVAGLLVFTVWVNGRGFSGAACSAALFVLMLPTQTRASEEILRTVPDSLREGSLALGAPQWKVITRVVLPTARAGLLTASILAVARSIGETAPAILTAFGSSVTNTNPFHGPQASLPLMVWDLIRQPNQVQIDRAWTALLILVLFVLIAFTLARWVGSRGDKKLGRRR